MSQNNRKVCRLQRSHSNIVVIPTIEEIACIRHFQSYLDEGESQLSTKLQAFESKLYES